MSLYEAFGVTSPNTDTKTIPLDKVVPVGTLDTAPDKGFVFEYRTLRRALKNIGERKPVWCWGPAGCGKTEFFVQIAARLRRPAHVISFGEETSIRELLGTFRLSKAEGNGFETRFEYGLLAKAIVDPMAIVILDEFNMSPPGVSAQLNRLLEVGTISIPETGEAIKAADGVTFVVTANTPGSSDTTGIYAGSQVQNGATRSRFAGLKMGYLAPEKEEEVVVRATPSLNDNVKLPGSTKRTSELLVECGRMVRDLIDDGAVSLPFTVRNLKEWARSTLLLRDIRDGFMDAYGDLLTEDELTPVAEVFHKVFGVRIVDKDEQ